MVPACLGDGAGGTGVVQGPMESALCGERPISHPGALTGVTDPPAPEHLPHIMGK